MISMKLSILFLPLLMLAADPPKPKVLADKDKLMVREQQLALTEIRAQKAEMQVQFAQLVEREKAAQSSINALIDALRPADCPKCQLQNDLTWLEPAIPTTPEDPKKK
jgi:hypothetical protein